ncbi:MAG: RHS repeat domain-containing protein [Candidatus Obscuribacterales bacterium]
MENAVIGGTATTSDVLTITVFDPDLTGGKNNKAYTVQGGDGLDDIADGLKTAINADTDLQNIGVSATAVGPVVTIKSTSQNATTYDQSTSANATASIDLFVNQNSAEYLVVGGAKTTSDQISLVVYDADLSGGSKTVSYTVQGGDTLSTITSGLASAVSSDTDLQAIAVSASSSGTVVTIESNSVNATTYRATTSSGATETAILGLPQNGVQTAVIGGTKTTSDTLTITVYDAGLSSGSKAVDYVVQSGDDLDAIAAGIATAINGDTDLQSISVSASSSSKVVFIASSSVNATSYTQSVSGGATETITLAPSTSVTQFAYDDVNAITSISAGGAARVEGLSNKALKSAEVDSSAVSLGWSQSYSGNTSLSAGNNSVDVELTDGANNTASASHQVFANSGSSASPTFDDNGNMTSDGTNTYEWDAENRLIKINYPGSQNNSQFTYDALGRNTMIVEVSGGSTTGTKQFVWCSSDRCEIRDQAGIAAVQLFSRGQKVLTTEYLFSTDHLGSIREMTNSGGSVETRYKFSPYGRIETISENITSEFGYARFYAHYRSGLGLAVHRPYSPVLGRWTCRDPIQEREGPNLFSYLGGNPIIGSDRSGLSGGENGGNQPRPPKPSPDPPPDLKPVPDPEPPAPDDTPDGKPDGEPDQKPAPTPSPQPTPPWKFKNCWKERCCVTNYLRCIRYCSMARNYFCCVDCCGKKNIQCTVDARQGLRYPKENWASCMDKSQGDVPLPRGPAN